MYGDIMTTVTDLPPKLNMEVVVVILILKKHHNGLCYTVMTTTNGC